MDKFNVNITLNFENWTFAEYLQFNQALGMLDMETVAELLPKIIHSWDFAEAPTAEAILDMDIPVLRTLAKTVEEVASGIMTAEKHEGYVVSLKNWKIRDLGGFRKALSTMDTAKLADYLVRAVKEVPKPFKMFKDETEMLATGAEPVMVMIGVVSTEMRDRLSEGN